MTTSIKAYHSKGDENIKVTAQYLSQKQNISKDVLTYFELFIEILRLLSSAYSFKGQNLKLMFIGNFLDPTLIVEKLRF